MMTLRIASLLALPMLLLGACDAADPDPSTDTGTDRAPLGKADAESGSCEDRCDDAYDPSQACQCDADCAEFGDCCEDLPLTCLEGSCDPSLVCGAAQTCVDGLLYPSTCGPDNCDEPLGPCEGDDLDCDPTLICGAALTCVDGQLYPSTCGPANCAEPIGPCDDDQACDPTLICGLALTCVDGNVYPTTCGPANCDAPLGPCETGDDSCDPTLICGQALSCVDGDLYPTTCGPANCDDPIGSC